MIIRRDRCLLCRQKLIPADGYQLHPEVVDCDVRFTDEFGVSIDEPEPEPEPEPVNNEPAPFLVDGEPVYQIFPRVDEVLREIFNGFGVDRLGGASSGKGWSSFLTFERCHYLWKRRYVEELPKAIGDAFVERESLAVGTLIHVFLALHYCNMMPGSPYREITPRMVYDLAVVKADPAFVQEAWRVFISYRLFYQFDEITPLAVELDLKDPRTGESCRYDLIAWLDRGIEGYLPGTYIIEHKSSGRFDNDFLTAWPNDGEVIGQVALWEKLGLEKRFGKLQGTVMNLLGKQKIPKFHRTYVAPSSWRVKSHLDDLRRIEGLINLAKATDNFPRMRGNCIGRFGRCDLYNHCAAED